MYELNHLKAHLENQWQSRGKNIKWEIGPVEKLHKDFYIVEFAPSQKHNLWIYSTMGMSLEREDDNLIELHLFSNKQDHSLVELLSVAASYHRNNLPLGLHHTVNFGRNWQDQSKCSYGFISLPYLDGEELEIFHFENNHLHNLWLIPITEAERDYKIEKGWEELEKLFESKELDYSNSKRDSYI